MTKQRAQKRECLFVGKQSSLNVRLYKMEYIDMRRTLQWRIYLCDIGFFNVYVSEYVTNFVAVFVSYLKHDNIA